MDGPIAYLVAHPQALGVALRTPAALMLLVAAPVFFRWPHPVGRLPSALRTTAYIALVLSLAGLQLTTRRPDDHLTVVAAVDTSPSIDADGREWARTYVNRLGAQLAPGDELAVLAFGDGTTLLRPPAPPAPLADTPDASPVAVTDVAAALDAAAAILPGSGERRLVLLTDGNQTRGDAARRIPWLRAAGVHIDAAVPPRRVVAAVRVDKLAAPTLADSDQPVPVRVVAQNDGDARPAVLTLYLDDQIADSAAVELAPGRTALQMAPHLVGDGGHRLRAVLSLPDEPRAAPPAREVGVTLREHSRVLVLTPRRASAVARALQQKGARVDVQAPSWLHDHAGLQPYHAVVLDDVTAATLPASAAGILERWVRERGGGLVFAGGAATYGDAALARTALARLLPVTLEPNRPKPGARERMALMLVIDRSNSMGYNSRIGTRRDGEKLRYAKQAALAVVQQLKDQDQVGVIAFDSKPYEIAPLRALSQNRRELEALVPRLVENGGTDFLDALTGAHRQLRAARVRNRHVILLTDGDTNRATPGEYAALTTAMARDGIRITTIRVGDNTVNVELLRDISRRTGGEFHYVDNARALPDLMLREAARALAPAAPSAETHQAQIATASALLQGLEEPRLPPLSGYAFAKPKPGAEVLLRVPRGDRADPLLTVWQHGLGRVAAFTASPGDDTERWVVWPDFTKFWSQTAQWVAREQADDELAISARRRGDTTDLTVRAAGPGVEGATMHARLTVGDRTRELDLVQHTPREFTASLLDVPPGRHAITMVTRFQGGAVREQAMRLTVPTLDDGAAAEFARTAPDLALLTRLTAGTGGRLNAPADALFERHPGTRAVAYPLDWLLLPLAMLLFLADTALRLLGRLHAGPAAAQGRTMR